MNEATILSHVVRALQSLMPGAGIIEIGRNEAAFLYAPHVIAVLPFLEAAGRTGTCGQFYLRASLGRYFSKLLKCDHQAVEWYAQALDISEPEPGVPESDVASVLYDMGYS